MCNQIQRSEIRYGLFLNALISFLLIASAVCFVVVPMNAWKARQARGQATPNPATKTCPACMESIVSAAQSWDYCGEMQPDETLRDAAWQRPGSLRRAQLR
ncbi:MAG: MscL family protein [Candidatus Korobacteraceae bacterium]